MTGPIDTQLRRANWVAEDALWHQPLVADSDFPILLKMPPSSWHAVKRAYGIEGFVIGKRVYHDPQEVATKLKAGARRRLTGRRASDERPRAQPQRSRAAEPAREAADAVVAAAQSRSPPGGSGRFKGRAA